MSLVFLLELSSGEKLRDNRRFERGKEKSRSPTILQRKIILYLDEKKKLRRKKKILDEKSWECLNGRKVSGAKKGGNYLDRIEKDRKTLKYM